jgi:hypothetical protein
MASITIRNLDETLKRKLRVRAAHRNHSMEDEVRTFCARPSPGSPRRWRIWQTPCAGESSRWGESICPCRRAGRCADRRHCALARGRIGDANTDDFADCGLTVISPWDGEGG